MNDFLNQVYFNNSIRSYLAVAAVILVVLLFKKYIARYIGILIFKVIQLRYKSIHLQTFLSLVVNPLGLFLAVIVTVGALDRLTMPDLLDFRVYKISFREIVDMTGSFLIIFTFFRLIIKSIDFIMLGLQDRYLKSSTDRAHHQLVFFFKDLIKVLVGVIGGLFILKYTFKYDVKGLLTGLSIVGAAVAFALKESLENLIASIVIFFDKPFALGDSVKLNDVSGTIEKIGLRSTRIRSDAKTYITVPNKQMVDSVLDNQSDRLQRKAAFKFSLGSSTTPQQIESFLAGIEKILQKPDILSPSVSLTDITENAIIVQSEFLTTPELKEFSSIRQRVLLEIMQLMEGLQLTTAGAVSDIQIVQPKEKEKAS